MADGRAVIQFLAERFADRAISACSVAGELSLRFPAGHEAVGDAMISVSTEQGSSETCAAWLSVGRIIPRYQFADFDAHRPSEARWARIAEDCARFVSRLFDDRLLLWISEDGVATGWREGGPDGALEPLVIDDRTYELFVWSGPLGKWRLTDAVLARRTIASDVERELLRERLESSARQRLDEPTARLAKLILRRRDDGRSRRSR